MAAEQWPVLRAAYSGAAATPAITLPEELDAQVSRSDAWLELVRGRIEHCGPVTAAELSEQLDLEEGAVVAALELLEGRGSVLRGQFQTRQPSQAAESCSVDESSGDLRDQPSPATSASGPQQWCDRRLLARIHRLTLEGLRRRIQPVEPSDFIHFLCRRHGIGEARWMGPGGVREVLALLQGYEAPAGAWEGQLLPGRLDGYDPQWLDQLFSSGECMWGRLRTPARQSDATGAMTRAAPLSLFFREDLAWLLPERAPADPQGLHAYSRKVLETLQQRGALFFAELKSAAELLPEHLEAALRELSALGGISSDMFAAIRVLSGGRRHAGGALLPAGRWSLFPGAVELPDDLQRCEQWCRLLLRRYGVLFAELAMRESSAPAWRDLARILRRMELRGEVRGGRFVRGVAGEQFAEPGAVERLRAAREEPDRSWRLLSACDPLNLTGVITDEARVPAVQSNLLAVRGGVCLAARIRGQVEFFAQDLSPEEQNTIRLSLLRGRLLAPGEERSLVSLPARYWRAAAESADGSD